MRSFLPIAVALVVVLVAGVFWFLFAQPAAPSALDDALVAESDEVEPDAPLSGPLPGVTAPSEMSELKDVSSRATNARTPVQPVADKTTSTARAANGFEARLVSPSESRLQVASLRAELFSETGKSLTFEGQDVEAISFANVEREVYQLRIEAEGYTFIPRTFDFTSRRGTIHAKESVTLWPTGWIPIYLLGPDGKPFMEAPAPNGSNAKNQFIWSLEFRFSTVLAVEGERLPPLDFDLAKFWPATDDQRRELPEGLVGALEFHTDAPLWVGLWVHGLVREGRVVLREDSLVAFSMDQEAIDAALASLKFKLVDLVSGEAVADARAALLSFSTANTPHKSNSRSPDVDGVVTFEGLIPGWYMLSIHRGDRIVQRRLNLETSVAQDLGTIAIGTGPGLIVRVVNRDGVAMDAMLHWGPYQAGENVHVLFSPSSYLTMGGDGTWPMPMPDRPTVLRAQSEFTSGSDLSPSEFRSRNYLIDPKVTPTEIVIVAERMRNLQVVPAMPWVEWQRVVFEDELGLIVTEMSVGNLKHLRVNLVPGAYTVRRWSGADPLGTIEVNVADNATSVACP